MAPEHITSALLRRRIISLEQQDRQQQQQQQTEEDQQDGLAEGREAQTDSNDAGKVETAVNDDDNRDAGSALYILDGYPRSPEQAEHFVRWFDDPQPDQGAYFHRDSTIIVHLLASKETIMERLKNRLIHDPSGRTYNTVTNPPKQCDPYLDDVTGEPLTRREDDTSPEAVKNRVETYKRRTIPTMEVLDQHGFVVHDVKEGTIEEVHERIVELLQDHGFMQHSEKSAAVPSEGECSTSTSSSGNSGSSNSGGRKSGSREMDSSTLEEMVEQQQDASAMESGYGADKRE